MPSQSTINFTWWHLDIFFVASCYSFHFWAEGNIQTRIIIILVIKYTENKPHCSYKGLDYHARDIQHFPMIFSPLFKYMFPLFWRSHLFSCVWLQTQLPSLSHRNNCRCWCRQKGKHWKHFNSSKLLIKPPHSVTGNWPD